MTISPLAGKPAPKEMLVDLARLAHLLVLVISAVYDTTCEKPMLHSALLARKWRLASLSMR